MTNGIYKITEDFEKALSDYTGSPYVILDELKSRDPEIWGNVEIGSGVYLGRCSNIREKLKFQIVLK